MRWGMGNDHKPNLRIGVIKYAMPHLGGNLQALLRRELMKRAIELHGKRPGNDVEKLPGLGMIMRHFRSLWRHPLLNHTQTVMAK